MSGQCATNFSLFHRRCRPRPSELARHGFLFQISAMESKGSELAKASLQSSKDQQEGK